MWAESSRKPPAEPAWVKIAHALLIYGDERVRLAYWPTQTDFWDFVVGLNGRGIGRNAGARAVSAMEREGRYFLRRPLRFGPGMGHVLGVSIGTESVRAALFTANGDIAKVSDGVGIPSGPGVTFDPILHAAEAVPIPQPAQLGLPVEELLGRIAAVAKHVASRAVRDPGVTVEGRLPLLGVACGWPAPINRTTKLPTGTSLRATGWGSASAPGGRPPSLPQRVATRLGIPVSRSHAINDANAVAFGVAFDASRREPLQKGPLGGVILAVRAGGALGAGTMVMSSRAHTGPVDHAGAEPDGPSLLKVPLPRSRFLRAYVLEGDGGVAGELGHWQVPDADLREISDRGRTGLVPLAATRCTCGRARCLDLFASGTAVIDRLRASGVEVPHLPPGTSRASTSIVHDLLREATDERIVEALEDAGRLIGRSLSAPVLMLNPESITLSGSLALEHVKNGIERERGFWQHVNEARPGLLHLLERRENTYAVARGAALAVFRGQLYRRFDDPSLDLGALALMLSEEDVALWNEPRAA